MLVDPGCVVSTTKTRPSGGNKSCDPEAPLSTSRPPDIILPNATECNRHSGFQGEVLPRETEAAIIASRAIPKDHICPSFDPSL